MFAAFFRALRSPRRLVASSCAVAAAACAGPADSHPAGAPEGAAPGGGAPAGDARQPQTAAARDAALADTLTRLITDAYDFARPGVVERLLGLYAPHDPVVSAAAGRVTASRALLAQSIREFWTRVGQNMRDPRFVVRERYATALGPDAAVLTITYAIPHETPAGAPHTVAGAWTAVFQRQGGRWLIVQEHLSDLPQPVGP